MPRSRPYAGLSTAELKAKTVGATDAVRDDIIYELGFRARPAAKALLEELTGISSSHVHRLDEEAARPRRSASNRRATGEGAAASPEFPPTEEQQRAVSAFLSGGGLKVSAFAGAGKTSTLQLMAAQRQERGVYLAFNRSIALEARSKFPAYVDTKTTHALAARQVRGLHTFSRSKMFDPLGTNQLASTLELKRTNIDDKVSLTPVQLAFLLLGTVRGFMRRADRDITPEHVPISGRLRGLDDAAAMRVKNWIVEQAKLLWSRMINPGDGMPLGHDGYLKLWSLSNPRLDYSFILLDEAQDTNPVVLHVLTRQPHAQMVYVGDQHQQIYEWRGAVNAMAQMRTERSVKLTQSFRFGPAIAEAASAVLRALGEPERLRGHDPIHSSIVSGLDTRAVLARTNATVISEALAALNRERKPHIVGGTQELQALVQDVYALNNGEPGSHPDFFGFTSWDEVVAFASTDEGEDIRPFVTLVQQNGPGRLWAAITNSVEDEGKADVVISTAHKAKGREWSSVRIADDFSSCRTEQGLIPEAEARLFYVAITRAKETLCIDSELLGAFTSSSRRNGTAASGEAAPAR
jgi:UvrD-like helicase family protein